MGRRPSLPLRALGVMIPGHRGPKAAASVQTGRGHGRERAACWERRKRPTEISLPAVHGGWAGGRAVVFREEGGILTRRERGGGDSPQQGPGRCVTSEETDSVAGQHPDRVHTGQHSPAPEAPELAFAELPSPFCYLWRVPLLDASGAPRSLCSYSPHLALEEFHF